MPRRIIQIILMGVIVALTSLGFAWALRPLLSPPQGLYDGNEAHLIESRYPHHLIEPTWLGDNNDSSMLWCVAETYARLAVVALGTLGLFLLCRIGVEGGRAGLRPNLPALLLPPAATVLVMSLLQILPSWDHAQAPFIRLALLIVPLTFIFLAVIQFIALQFARGQQRQLLLVYGCGTLVFAVGYAAVTYLLRVGLPTPPNIVYFNSPAGDAFGAFFIIAGCSPFLLAPMAAVSWFFLRRRKILGSAATETP